MKRKNKGSVGALLCAFSLVCVGLQQPVFADDTEEEQGETQEEQLDEETTSLNVQYDVKSGELRIYGLEIPAVGVEITLLFEEVFSELPTFTPYLSIDYGYVKEASSKQCTIYVAGNHSLNDGANFVLGTLEFTDNTVVDTISVKAVDFLLQEVYYGNVVTEVVLGGTALDSEEEQGDSDEEDSDHNQEDDNTQEETDYAQRYADILAQYTDIEGHWGEERIVFVIDRGYFAGVSDYEFSPDATMTRGMFVTVLGNVSGTHGDSSYISPFTDVNTSDWFYPYVGWAVDHGIATGMGDGTFAPNQSISREQLAVMLLKYILFLEVEIPSLQQTDAFSDHDAISEWAVDAVYYMQSRGLITGKEGKMFDPQGQATRAEVATVLMNFMNLIENPIETVG